MPATIFGVPTHPLAVHAAVVLVPLAAIAVVLAAFWPAARRRYGPVVLVLATLAVLSVPLAKESGESLARRLPATPLIQQHVNMADGILPWAAGLWIAAVAVVALPWVYSLVPARQAERQAAEVAAPALAAAGRGTAPEARGPALPETVTSGISRLASWRRPIAVAAATLAVVTVVGSTVEIVRIGHSGAKAVWSGTPGASIDPGTGTGR